MGAGVDRYVFLHEADQKDIEANGNKKNFPLWEKSTRAERTRLGISWGYRPWTSQEGVLLQGVVPHERNLHLLDCAWVHRMQLDPGADGDIESLARNFWIDLSESMNRHPWGHLGTLKQGSAGNVFNSPPPNLHPHPLPQPPTHLPPIHPPFTHPHLPHCQLDHHHDRRLAPNSKHRTRRAEISD